MPVKLGGQHSQDLFKFKIGDRVQVRVSKTPGVVIEGAAYPEMGRDKVFYTIEGDDGRILTVMQDDILPISK